MIRNKSSQRERATDYGGSGGIESSVAFFDDLNELAANISSNWINWSSNIVEKKP